MDKIKDFSAKHEENTLPYIFAGFLLGLIFGFIMSPIKNGVAIGSYNGAYNKFSDSNNVTKKGY